MQKAAGDARSLDDFCERLGTHVQAPKDRAAFIQPRAPGSPSNPEVHFG